MDHITPLPNCVKSHILALLPIESVAQTSILSKAWKYTWTYICDVDLADRRFIAGKPKSKEEFIGFMENIFLYLKALRSIHLHCEEIYDPQDVTAWVTSALRHNLENIDLKLRRQIGVILPQSLYKETALRNLNLEMPCTLRMPQSSHFPSLKHLILSSVEISSGLRETYSVSLRAPELKILEIKCCSWFELRNLEIHALALTRVVIETKSDVGVSGHSIRIICNEIGELESVGGIPDHILLDVSSVRSVSVLNQKASISDPDFKRIGLKLWDLLRGASTSRHIILSSFALKAIEEAKKTEESLLPRLDGLESLQIANSGYTAKLLVGLLDAASNLKILTIDQGVDEYNYSLAHIPSCLHRRLERVTFNYVLLNTTSNLDLEKYLLKNGATLRVFAISSTPHQGYPLAEVVARLSQFDKASKNLKIVRA